MPSSVNVESDSTVCPEARIETPLEKKTSFSKKKSQTIDLLQIVYLKNRNPAFFHCSEMVVLLLLSIFSLLRASIMGGGEPAASDVGEREIRREKRTTVSRDAGWE